MDPSIIIMGAAFFGVVAMFGAAAFFFKDWGGTKAESRLAMMTGRRGVCIAASRAGRDPRAGKLGA